MKEKAKLCIVIAADIDFLGGLGIYQKNLMRFLKKHFDITYFYKGTENKDEIKDGIRYFQVKTPGLTFLENLVFEFKAGSFLKKNGFDVINSHGFTGLWMAFFGNKKETKLVHTYHGSTYHFYKNHLRRFGPIKKILFYLLLTFPYLIERLPMKIANKIICNSNHVRNEMIRLYGKRGDMEVIRTGVDLEIFRLRNKGLTRKRLKLKGGGLYGLYIGRGGFWTKGLDKVISLSREIYKSNKNYRLLIIGADRDKVRHLIDDNFAILLPPISRGKIPLYYNAADLFFSMSRYEGGAPTMVTSEAMASRCLIITDREANQEIIEDGKNGLMITDNYKEEARIIINLLNDKGKTKGIINNSLNTIKEFSFEKWGKRYIDFLIN
ncbi:MAG: glycosyltransferase family 4 protein [Nanoarchaeota archaeon]|nr:glycosyltransferase family 4 protein [Nanoarchaeota archaeon]